MSKHTPGPWRLIIESSGKIHKHKIVHDCGPGYIKPEICTLNPYQIVTREHDARLIAAAPDLLAALKAVIPYVDLQHISPTIIMAEAAIAKAEGKKFHCHLERFEKIREINKKRGDK